LGDGPMYTAIQAFSFHLDDFDNFQQNLLTKYPFCLYPARTWDTQRCENI
jgi:hypothetical protein